MTAVTTEPQLNALEMAFLTRWQGLDFSDWNEQVVREEFIIGLLHLLGYRRGTSFDIDMEKPLRLTKPYHRIGRKKVDIDYAPSIRLRHFWIVEAKPGTQRKMQFGDILQAHLYAIHPEVQARYIVLCNGWEIRVYDALTVTSVDDALHTCCQADCLSTFPGIKAMLGAETMLSFERDRLLSLASKTLDVEIDLERFHDFARKMRSLLREGEQRVRSNAQRHQANYFFKWRQARDQELRAATIPELLVMMDLPEDTLPQASREFARRVLEAPPDERPRLVERLTRTCQGRPHNVLRGRCVHVLVTLLEQGVQLDPAVAKRSVKEHLEWISTNNIRYWAHISNALCHLDNVAMRVSYKLCTRIGTEYLTELAVQGKSLMNSEDRIGIQPSAAGLMVPSVGHAQDILWRKYCSGNVAEVWAGIWTLQSVEEELERLPPRGYPDGGNDMMFFEYQGLTMDTLRAMTWNALHPRRALLRKEDFSVELLDFAELTWDQMRAGIPQERRAPSDFKPSVVLKDLVLEVLPHVLGLRTVAFLSQVASENRRE